jgi:hypothetical protein
MTITIDPYALCQVGRERGLKPIARSVLGTMAFQVHWRSIDFTWSGSIADLEADTGHTWRAIIKALDALVAEGLIEIVDDFGQGSKGRVRVLVYERLVVLSEPRRRSREALAPESDTDPRSRASAGSPAAQDPALIPRFAHQDPAPIPRRSRDGAGSSCLDSDPRGKGSSKEVLGTRAHARTRARASEEPPDDDAPPLDDDDAPPDEATAFDLDAEQVDT